MWLYNIGDLVHDTASDFALGLPKHDLDWPPLRPLFRDNIISRISTQLTCCNCIDALKSEKHPGLIECRDISEKMTYPSEFVKKLVHVCETVLSQELEKNWMGKKYFFDYVSLKICNSFVSLHDCMIKLLDNHGLDLMKKFVSCYCSIRFKSHAKLQNDLLKKKRLRAKLSKMILFNHQ